MQVKKTDLDAQITNLEYKKLGLEQFERLVNRQETAGFLEQTGRHVGDTENESDARDSGTLVTTIQNQRCSENEQIESPVTRQENQSFELNAEECSLKVNMMHLSGIIIVIELYKFSYNLNNCSHISTKILFLYITDHE